MGSSRFNFSLYEIFNISLRSYLVKPGLRLKPGHTVKILYLAWTSPRSLSVGQNSCSALNRTLLSWSTRVLCRGTRESFPLGGGLVVSLQCPPRPFLPSFFHWGPLDQKELQTRGSMDKGERCLCLFRSPARHIWWDRIMCHAVEIHIARFCRNTPRAPAAEGSKKILIGNVVTIFQSLVSFFCESRQVANRLFYAHSLFQLPNFTDFRGWDTCCACEKNSSFLLYGFSESFEQPLEDLC